MSDKTPPAIDPERNAQMFKEFTERTQRIINTFMERQKMGDTYNVVDPVQVGTMFMEASMKMMADPAKFAAAQTELMQGYADLWQATAKRMSGEDVVPVVEPAKDDRRFKDNAWTDEAVFDHIKQSYLLASNWLTKQVRTVDDIDEKTREKLEFYTRQWVDAMSPTNFVATNPKVLKAASETNGENLIKGLDHLLTDLEKAKVIFGFR